MQPRCPSTPTSPSPVSPQIFTCLVEDRFNTANTAYQRFTTAPTPSAGAATTAKKSSAGRPQRPSAVKRRSTQYVLSKASVGRIKEGEHGGRGEEEGTTATFLQYCATCEKQIQVPDASILYCSESCRNGDTSKSSPTSRTSPALPSRSTWHADEGRNSPRDIVPPASPTAPSFARVFEFGTDNDVRDEVDRRSWSEAEKMLEIRSSHRFPTLPQAGEMAMSLALSEKHDAKRSSYGGASSTAIYSTSSSVLYPSLSSSSLYANMTMTPARPLPRRHNPSYSASASPRSVDLVTPYGPGAVSLNAAITKSSSTTSTHHLDG
ncbi:MAG: hypothetical protein M1838_005557 [Thelocarpon superellum]|nr:MAG: hypothetical protein M1838_005557 [Thelocarpon superellum]